jgi:putative phosphoesterase
MEGRAVPRGSGRGCGRARRDVLTRLAVISDTHLPRGKRALPDDCVSRLTVADLILHAGDFVSTTFYDELRAIGPPVEAVCGNMDEPALKASLPLRRIVEVEDVRIGMVHNGGPRDGREARLAARFDECDAVVYGHTHVPQVERFRTQWIFNPGSPTERRSAPVHSMIVLTVKGKRITPSS